MDNATEPLLMLKGRIFYRDREGQVQDVTDREQLGLKRFAEDGSLVLHILNNCRKRLDLLSMAAEGRTQLDASLVRLTVQDVRAELEDGSEVAGYVHLTRELFAHAEAGPPSPTSDHNISLKRGPETGNGQQPGGCCTDKGD